MKNVTLLTLASLLVVGVVSCSKTLEVKKQPAMPAPVLLTKGVSATINNIAWSAGARSAQTDSASTQPADSTATEPASFYATFGSDSSSLIIFAGGSFSGFENASWAKILLWVRGFNGEGNYPLGLNDSASIAVFSVVYPDQSFNQYYTGASTNSTGNINITSYDRVNNTISGNFDFKAKSAIEGDSSIVVNNGRFAAVPLH